MKHAHGSSCTSARFFLPDSNNRKFSWKDLFIKKTQTSKLWISVLWESNNSMRTDSQTDMAKLKVDFRNFANAKKKGTFCCNNGLSPIH